MPWDLNGNPDPDIGPNNFLGTRADDPLRIRTRSDVNKANVMTITPAPDAATTGNVGIGTPTPQAKLDVAGTLRVSGDVGIWGTLNVSDNITLASGRTFSAPGRLHIDGQEILYLLNRQGVIVSTAWGGNGNLRVDGALSVGSNLDVASDITLGPGRTFSAPGRLHISGAETLYLLNTQGVIVSTAWGGNGNLTADGTVTIGHKLGVFGQPADIDSPPGSNPRGLAGGIHTWDVEAEGTIWCRNDIWAENDMYADHFRTNSDARAKTNVAKLSDVMDKLEAIRGVSFEQIESRPSTMQSVQQRNIGVIAQEVETVFPELVCTHAAENHKTVDYSGLTGVLIEAAKELKAENAALRCRIEALEQT